MTHTNKEMFETLEMLFHQMLENIKHADLLADKAFRGLSFYQNMAKIATYLNHPGCTDRHLAEAKKALFDMKIECFLDVTGVSVYLLHPVIDFMLWQIAERQH